MLEGFEVYSLSTGMASITLSKNGVGFSKSAVAKMGKCQYVRLLIDHNGRRVAIKKTTQDDEEAIAFFNPQKKLMSVRWNNRELQKTIADMMGWKLDEGVAYKTDGTYSYEDEALIFDLNQARETTTK